MAMVHGWAAELNSLQFDAPVNYLHRWEDTIQSSPVVSRHPFSSPLKSLITCQETAHAVQ